MQNIICSILRSDLLNRWHWYVPKGSFIPAIILVTLVAFIFGTLRNYGPESTVRQFHATMRKIYDSQMNGAGIEQRDWEELQSLFVEDLGEPRPFRINPEAQGLFQIVNQQFQQGATYSLARMDRVPREVRIVVLYTPPTQMQMPIVWVVTKPTGQRAWKISVRKTIGVMN